MKPVLLAAALLGSWPGAVSAQTRVAGAPPAPAAAPRSTPAAAKAGGPSSRHGDRRPAPQGGSLAAISRANDQARERPTAGAFVNSALYYDFEPGRLYGVHTSPRFLTTIALKPGEKLISKAAGDTVRWVLGETVSGAGEGTQVIVFLKPIRPDLRTNIVLTTDQRTYLIDAVSTASNAYTSVLAWNYPQDQTAARARAEAGERSAVGEVRLDRLDFSYRIENARGRSPAWRPIRVFDDGTRTFIAFPDSLSTTEAPPLFVLGAKGEAQLVNYRVKDGYYVVDQLIDRAELRLGEAPQTIVRIIHQGPRR